MPFYANLTHFSLKKEPFEGKTLKNHKNHEKVIALNEFDDYHNKFGCKAL